MRLFKVHKLERVSLAGKAGSEATPVYKLYRVYGGRKFLPACSEGAGGGGGGVSLFKSETGYIFLSNFQIIVIRKMEFSRFTGHTNWVKKSRLV